MKNSPPTVARPARRPAKAVALAVAVATAGLALVWNAPDTGWWRTPDQQGRQHFERGEFTAAAEAFRDPIWRGAAWYRAGEFEKAAQAFALRDTPEALFNQGNSWLFRGKYELAAKCYEQALEKRPGWKEADVNRDVATARAKRLERKGGDMGNQEIGADEIVFDKNKKPGGQDTGVSGEEVVSSATMQALWLRRVQTKPADFLKAKFAYQQQAGQEATQ